MTPERLEEILADLSHLGVTARGLANLWGYGSHATVAQWRAGKVAVPDDVERWLENLHRWWKANLPRWTPPVRPREPQEAGEVG